MRTFPIPLDATHFPPEWRQVAVEGGEAAVRGADPPECASAVEVHERDHGAVAKRAQDSEHAVRRIDAFVVGPAAQEFGRFAPDAQDFAHGLEAAVLGLLVDERIAVAEGSHGEEGRGPGAAEKRKRRMRIVVLHVAHLDRAGRERGLALAEMAADGANALRDGRVGEAPVVQERGLEVVD